MVTIDPPIQGSDETDPTLVTQPVAEIVEDAMVGICSVHPHRQMCVIFDVVNPLRQFKRGVQHTEDPNVPFPTYSPSPEEDPDVTETDEAPGLMQYEPVLPEVCVPPVNRVLPAKVTNLGRAPLATFIPGGSTLQSRSSCTGSAVSSTQ